MRLDEIFEDVVDTVTGRRGGDQDVQPASQDPYGDPGDPAPASQDPYGDPGDVRSASEDPYGDPADEEEHHRGGLLGRLFGR